MRGEGVGCRIPARGLGPDGWVSGGERCLGAAGLVVKGPPQPRTPRPQRVGACKGPKARRDLVGGGGAAGRGGAQPAREAQGQDVRPWGPGLGGRVSRAALTGRAARAWVSGHSGRVAGSFRHRHRRRRTGSQRGWNGRRRSGASNPGMCKVLTKWGPKGPSKATCMRMRKRKFLSKKALGTMRSKRYPLGLNLRALGLSHKAQSLNPKAPGLSLKAQVSSPEFLGLCPQALNLHPEPLNQILRALSLNHKALGMSPKALGMNPGALDMNPGALDMNLGAPSMSPRAQGMNPRTLSSKPKALNLKLKVPNFRKVQRCFSVLRKRIP